MLLIVDIAKKSEAKLKDLQNLITPRYASCWNEIGIQLDIPIETILSIKVANPTDPVWCCNKMFIIWYQCNTERSWGKVIEAIDSPAVTSIVRTFDNPSVLSPDERLETASHLACRLKIISLNFRYINEYDDFSLPSPKHFTSVALIHHKGQKTRKEVLAVATLQNSGDFNLQKIYTDNEYFKQCRCTKNISEIFAEIECANGTIKCPGKILIEGVPGIGKTILSKEIVFQWAKGKLLSDKLLVFLIYLREPESHKINSLEAFVEYVCRGQVNYDCDGQVEKHVLKYMIDSKGEKISVVFDGYDELPEKLRKDSFLYKMMIQNVADIPLCNVIITSRPNASAIFHGKVDLRVEILGFTNEDRKAYIVEALKDKDKIKKMMDYLNNNPAIDAYCYIPLNMTIVLNFFKNNDVNEITELPNTQTGINEKFICTTISRYVNKLQGLTLNFSSFTEIKTACNDHTVDAYYSRSNRKSLSKILQEISKLAFKALESDKIVFTTADLKQNCPWLEMSSDYLNGLGLLKVVHFFNTDNNKRNVSFNFLHFSIQEILAAYHITLMAENDQLKCMEKTFWDNKYYNTWIMYVGLMKKKISITFKHFLSGHRFLAYTRLRNSICRGAYFHVTNKIANDKIKCLFLFQCFSESESADLLQHIGKLLQDNIIDLSNQIMSAINLHTLSLYLTRSTTKKLMLLDLSKCFVGDSGIKQLYKSFISNNRSEVCVNTLNFSYNNLTQFSIEILASLILEWKVQNIEISCNDINQHALNEALINQIMQPIMQLRLKDNTLICHINKSTTLFVRLSEFEYMIFSFNSDLKQILSTFKNTLTNHTSGITVVINMLRDCEVIDYLNIDAAQIKVSDIANIIRNNKLMEYLCLQKLQNPNINEYNNLDMIFDALKFHVSLKYVDMRLVTINSDLIKDVATIISNNNQLQEIKISKLVLQHCNFQDLKDCLGKINVLNLLSITDCIFTRDLDVNILIMFIRNNLEITELILSNCTISINKLFLNCLSCSSRLKRINFSYCQLYSNDIKQILIVLKEMKHLQHIDISGNAMTDDVTDEIVAVVINNKEIQKLYLPDCVLSQRSLNVIIQALLTASQLQCVDFSKNKINDKLASNIAVLFTDKIQLKQLKFAKLTLKQNGFQHLKMYLVKLQGLKCLRITSCRLSNQDITLLESFVYRSQNSIQELLISNCQFIDHKMIMMADDVGGVYDQLEHVELSNNTTTYSFDICKLLVFISCTSRLKQITLYNCHLQANEIKQILMILQNMRYLECVNLSGNAITKDDLVTDMKGMIINNKNLQKLSLPDCVLDQKDFKIIIQAMQKVSTLQSVDFSKNKIDDELASDVSILATNVELTISKLELTQSGFQHLKNYLEKIKVSNCLSITGCAFPMHIAMHTSVNGIQKLNLSRCKLCINQILALLSCNPTLNSLILSNCKLDSGEVKQIFSVLKQMKYLQNVDLSANSMEKDAIKDMVAMIKNNKEIQSVSLPDCALIEKELSIIIQAMQTVSSLQYVDFSTHQLKNELASDLAILIKKNSKLKQLKFSALQLNQNGYKNVRNFITIIKGLKSFNINGCNFNKQGSSVLTTVISKNTKIQELNLSNSKININQLLSILPYMNKISSLNLSNCQFQSDEINRLFDMLNQMKYLQHIDLSGNSMNSNVCDSLATMIKNNKSIHTLSLPNGRLDHQSLRIILQAMKNVSLLVHVNFSTNKIDNKLASDVADVFVYNNQLKQFHFAELVLQQSGFQHYLINHIAKIKGVKVFSIIGCNFTRQDANKLVTVIVNNSELAYLNLQGCKIDIDQLLSILEITAELAWLNLSNCKFNSEETKQIFSVLKQLKNLQHIYLSNNAMTNDAIKDFTAMIQSNKDIQVLHLPCCMLNQMNLKIVVQAMQTISSLCNVDFNTNTLDDNIAKDVANLIISNRHLEQLHFYKFALTQKGLHYLHNHLAKIKGINDFRITDCFFKSHKEIIHVIDAIHMNKSDIQKLHLSNCGSLKCNNETMLRIYGSMQDISLLQCFTLNKINITPQIGNKLLTMVSNCSNIEQLEMPGCNMDTRIYLKLIKCSQFKNITKINFSGNRVVRNKVKELYHILSSHTKLKSLDLSNCQLLPDSVCTIVNALKNMKLLQYVNLSTNKMTDGIADNVVEMIKNNKGIQKLHLPDGVLNQSNLKYIIQVMQTVSSLEYIDFSTNKIDNELASDVADLFAKNNKLKQLNFNELQLNKSGFEYISSCLVKIKEIKYFSITNCSFTNKDEANISLAISNNVKIQSLDLSCCVKLNKTYTVIFKQLENLQKFFKIYIFKQLQALSSLKCLKLNNITIGCKMEDEIITVIGNNCSNLEQLEMAKCNLSINIFFKITKNYDFRNLSLLNLSYNCGTSDQVDQAQPIISYNTKLKCLKLSNCKMQSNKIIQVFKILKKMRHLQYVDLSANTITDDAAYDIAAMITNNQNIQQLLLPNCVFSNESLKVIYDAIMTISSLEILGSNYLQIDNESAYNLCKCNDIIKELKELRLSKLTLMHCGFQNLKDVLIKVKGLDDFTLNDCHLDDHDASIIEGLISNNTMMQKVNIAGCVLPESSKHRILKLLQHCTLLESVDFSNMSLNNQVEDVITLIRNKSKLYSIVLSEFSKDQIVCNQLAKSLAHIYGLKKLILTGCTFNNDQDAINIASAISNSSKIQELSLSNCEMTENALRFILIKLKTISSLKYINLNNIIISDQMEDEVIAVLCKNGNLEHLEMAGCNLSKNLYLSLLRCDQFMNIVKLNLSGNNVVSKEINKLLSVLSSHTKLKSLDLSNCQLHSNEINQIINVLRKMVCLQCVYLGANTMTDNIANDIAGMVSNNKDIQRLCLPHCVLSEASLRIIIQAMQNISSVEDANFSTKKDDELTSDIAVLTAISSTLKEFKVAKFTLNNGGFHTLMKYISTSEGFKLLGTDGSIFTIGDAAKLRTIFNNNSEVQELNILTNCNITMDQLLSILSCISELKWLDLCDCQFQSNEIRQVLKALKQNTHLKYLDLGVNTIASDTVTDLAAIITSNKQLEKFCLPHCGLELANLKIITEALQVVSSLHYVDFRTNGINSKLAREISTFISINSNLKQLKCFKLELNQNGFQHLKVYLKVMEGLQYLSITDCFFTEEEVTNLSTVIGNNPNIEDLHLTNCNLPMINQLLPYLAFNTKLKLLDLSDCKLQSKEIKQVFIILKFMKYLRYVNLSGNNMKSDAIDLTAAVISNNKNMQTLILPQCVLNEKDLSTIVQTIETVSSLHYVDFGMTNAVENELIGHIFSLFTNNEKVKQLNFGKLTLKQSDFQCLKTHFIKLKGLRHLKITNCTFSNEDTVYLETIIGSNHELQELLISNCEVTNCKINIMADNLDGYTQLENLELRNNTAVDPLIHKLSIFISYSTKLKQIILYNCQLQSNEIKQILMVLRYMKYLECVNLSGNTMTDDSVHDMEAMIVGNKLQKLCLPNCVINQENLRLIVQAMQTISSLKHVNFHAITIDSSLASDVAVLIDNNAELEQLKFVELKIELDQNGFNYLKTHLMIIKGIKYFTITGCTFTDQDVANLASTICNNPEIEEIDLSYSKTHNQAEMLQIFSKLNTLSSLRCLKLNNVSITDQIEHEIITLIHNNSNFESLELTGNNLSSNLIQVKRHLI